MYIMFTNSNFLLFSAIAYCRPFVFSVTTRNCGHLEIGEQQLLDSKIVSEIKKSSLSYFQAITRKLETHMIFANIGIDKNNVIVSMDHLQTIKK